MYSLAPPLRRTTIHCYAVWELRKAARPSLRYSAAMSSLQQENLVNGKSHNSQNGISEGQQTIPPLGMTENQFREAAQSSAEGIARYFDNIESYPVRPSIQPGYLQKLLPSKAPQQGEAWTNIEKDIERCVIPGLTHWQSPKYMAFFPANTSYPSMLGEFWSAALSAPAFNWICSPVITELETIVCDWVAQMLSLPEAFLSEGEGGGVVQLSASDTIATVMVAARERYIRRQISREGVTDPDEIEDRSCEIRAKLVALGSDQSHSSTKKSATIAGTRYRSIPTSRLNEFSLQGDELRSKIEQLQRQGLQPYYLTVTIGTTSTCAVDDLKSIAEVAKEYPDIWIHCDGAYAGTALALEEYQYLSQQLAFVDSFCPNLHKWLNVNFDASLLYVQKRRDLTDTLSITPAYLRNEFTDSGLVTDYRDWQIPLGRRFRALKIWFVVRTYGVDELQQHLRHGIDLGNLFADLLRSRSDLFSLFTTPAFGLVVFTVRSAKRPPVSANMSNGSSDPRPYQDMDVTVKPQAANEELEEANSLTKQVFDLVDQNKDFFLTSTIVDGTFAIRVVSANPLAQERYIREVFQLFVDAAEKSIASRTESKGPS